MKTKALVATVGLLLILAGAAWAGGSDGGSRALGLQEMASPCQSGVGYGNPADAYCLDLGYQLAQVQDRDGGQRSECVFPDGSACDTWQFLEGTCGGAYSYCARLGYGQITKADGQNAFSPQYAVCVSGRAEIGPVTDLIGLSRQLERSLPLEKGPPAEAARPEIEGRALLAAPPAAFSWRNHAGQDWMTAVKNQSQCGSCWAFSAVGSTEAVYNIDTNFPDLDLDLSEEFLNSDCPVPNPGSCCGGGHTGALNILRDDGVPDEACMPYDVGYYGQAGSPCSCFGEPSCDANCSGLPASCSHLTCADRCADWASRLTTIDSYHAVADGPGHTDIKQALVDEGPLATCLAMSGVFDANQVYRCTNCWDKNGNGTCETAGVCGPLDTCTSGIVGQDCTEDKHCDEDKNDDGVCNQADCGTNHCVVIAGYDDAGGFWIVKNSWGAGWNGDGYWNVGYGECHIEDYVNYVDPDDLNFPPVADAGGDYHAECQGATTSIALDGSASVDPNSEDTLTYAWTTDCPGGSFDDATVDSPVLTIPSSGSAGCAVACNVSLTVTDDDGASDAASAAVSVQDSTPPTLAGVPGNTTVECDAVPAPAAVTAGDTCDPSPALAFSEVRTDGSCADCYTLTRTWTATDACGNETSQVQVITVQDTTPPVLSGVPADETVECDAVPLPAEVTATDNCDGDPGLAFSEVRIDGSCPNNYTLTRTWTATDACGNETTESQVITVQDTTEPVIACNSPGLIVPPDAPISFTATATDNCDGDPWVVLTGYDCYTFTKKGKRIDKTESCVVRLDGDQVTILDSGGVGTTITWDVWAEDSCGNAAVAQCQVGVVRKGQP